MYSSHENAQTHLEALLADIDESGIPFDMLSYNSVFSMLTPHEDKALVATFTSHLERNNQLYNNRYALSTTIAFCAKTGTDADLAIRYTHIPPTTTLSIRIIWAIRNAHHFLCLGMN